MTFSSRPFRRRVLINTASTGLANVWAMAVALVTLPLLLRGMGAEAFGSWVLLQTFSAVTGWLSLADLGMRVSTTRAIAERAAIDDNAGVARVVSSAMAVYAVLGAVCAAALAVVGPYVLPRLFSTPAALTPDLRFAIRIFAMQVVLELLSAGVGACLEGVQRVDVARGLDSVRRTAVAVATAAVALQDGSLRGVAVASVLATLVGATVAFVVLVRLVPVRGGRPLGAETRGLLRYGTTVGLLNTTGVLHRTMDRLIVGAVFGPAEVALVEVATQVQNGASAILAASSYATLSSAPWLHARGDKGTTRELLERGTRYSLIVTLPAVVLAAVLAGPLVRVWIGDQFSEAAGLVTIAVLYIGMAAPLQVGGNLLQGVGRAGLVLRAAAAAVVVNLIASLMLVRVTGVVGVFQATLIGTAVLLPPLLRAVSRETGISASHLLRSAVLPTIAPAAAMTVVAGAVLALPLGDVATLAIGTIAGLAAYVAVSAQWVVSRDEIRELLASAKRDPGAPPDD